MPPLGSVVVSVSVRIPPFIKMTPPAWPVCSALRMELSRAQCRIIKTILHTVLGVSLAIIGTWSIEAWSENPLPTCRLPRSTLVV